VDIWLFNQLFVEEVTWNRHERNFFQRHFQAGQAPIR